jgi:hypothetical protein
MRLIAEPFDTATLTKNDRNEPARVPTWALSSLNAREERNSNAATLLNFDLEAFATFASEKCVGFVITNDLSFKRIPVQFAAESDGDVR